MNIVYLNGHYIAKNQAKISILDRGFLFADSIYEVIPVYQGKPFALQSHLDRFVKSANAITLPPPLSHREWQTIIADLLERNHLQTSNCSLYLQISRGANELRLHSIPQDYQPTILAFCQQPPTITHRKQRIADGFKAITLTDKRHHNCFIKSTALLPNVLAAEKAKQAGALDAILIRDGIVSEASSSNIFIVKAGVIKTPKLNAHILAGVTRKIVLALAKANALACQEDTISQATLFSADEIWLTSSNKEICPVVTLDEKTINNGQAGPLWHKINNYYQHLKTHGM